MGYKCVFPEVVEEWKRNIRDRENGKWGRKCFGTDACKGEECVLFEFCKRVVEKC